MKICITSEGAKLDSMLDPRFGRCSYFFVVDTETMEYEAIENSSTDATGGAGIKSAQLVAEKGVKKVLTGNCGPNAFQTLKAAGIDVITGVAGDIKSVIEKYKNGELKSADEKPSVDSHFGTKEGK